jgi:hypothetical protein
VAVIWRASTIHIGPKPDETDYLMLSPAFSESQSQKDRLGNMDSGIRGL